MPRQRDYAAEYQARQARARAAGFGSYYEQRVAGTSRGSRSRTVAAGHASIGQLERLDAESVEALLTTDFERDSRGRIVRVDILVIMADGEQHEFSLRGRALSPERLAAFVEGLHPGVPIGKGLVYLLRDADDSLVDE